MGYSALHWDDIEHWRNVAGAVRETSHRAGRSSEAGWWKGRPGLTATPYAAIAIAVVALGITTLVAKSKTLRAAESVAG
jgi:hypothetical protein